MKKIENELPKFLGLLSVIVFLCAALSTCRNQISTDNTTSTNELHSTGIKNNANMTPVTVEKEEKRGFISWARDVAFKNNSAWILTQTDELVLTNNNGKDWSTISTKAYQGFRCLMFVNDNEGLALNSVGEILKTIDAGKTWKKISSVLLNPGEIEYGAQMKFTDELEGIIVVTPGYVLKTQDGGKSWQELHPFNATKNLHCALTGGISIIGDNIWLTAEPGMLLKSEDRGKTWSFQKIQNAEGLIYDVFFISEKTGWITGFPGLGVFRTDNSGANWKVQFPFISSSKSVAINSLYFINENEGWAVGQNKWGKNGRGMGHGAVLHTVDGGTSWKQVQVGKGDSICSWVHFTDVNQGWILDRNNIYHTNNKGETWELVKSLTIVKK